MTDPKGRSLKECSKERLKRLHARKKAEEVFGESALKGKTVHHKDGVRDNNSKKNLQVASLKEHSAVHGRGHKKPTRKI